MGDQVQISVVYDQGLDMNVQYDRPRLELRDYLRILRRQWTLIVLAVVVVVASASVATGLLLLPFDPL